MKSTLLIASGLVVLIIAIPTKTFAQQPGWNWQNPVPTGNDLNDIAHPLLSDDVYIAGDAGTVLKSTDGVNFHLLTTRTTQPLDAIDTRAGTVWATGFGGTIIHSDDQGNSWNEQTSGTTEYLRGVDFLDLYEGWAVGHNRAILHTTDGGLSWESQSFSGTARWEDVDFIDENLGWIAGYDGKATILHTENGGSFWRGQANPAIHRLWAIDMQGDGTGWAVGERWTQLYTDDYGNTWTPGDSLSGADYHTVHYSPGGKVWIAGTFGKMLHSPDNGETWVHQSSGTGSPIHKVSFADETRGWAVGEGGVLQYTLDGGTTWDPAGTVFTRAPLRAVHFANRDTGWVAGEDGVIMRTDNGGETWRHQALVSRYTYNDIHFVGKDSGWVAGNDGILLRTISGGEGSLGIWPSVSTPTGTDANLYSVHFPNRMDGWAVGGQCSQTSTAQCKTSTIIHTTNGANTWHAQSSGTPNHLYGVFFASKTWGWAVGLGGTVLVTYDGGETWFEMPSGTTNRLTSVFAVDSLHVWATGARGTLIHSSDGGKTWQLQNTGTFEALNRVHFVDRNYGWAVGQVGTIIWTDDGGETWRPQSSGTNNHLTGVFFTDVGNGWVVGDKGSILYTPNGGVTASAFIQFVHGAADIALAIVDVYVNGQRVIDDLNYREASAKLAVPVGAIIGIAEGISSELGPEDPTFTVDLTAGETFAAVLAGEVGHADGPLSLITFPKKNPGKTLEPVSTGIVHAIVDGPQVDCYVNGSAVASALAFGDASITLSTSDQQIIHIHRHDDGSLVESFDVTLGTGSEAFPVILTGYMTPPPGSEDRTMSMMVVSETGEVSAPVVVTGSDDAIVSEFKLRGSYPNPFNPRTTVVFDLPNTSRVSMTVFDVLGRVARRIERGLVPGGARRTIVFDAEGLASGLYLYALRAEEADVVHSAKGSMLLMR